MLFSHNNRLTIICLTLFWFSALTCVHSASTQDLSYFRSLQVDKSQAAKVNNFYVAPYYGHHNHDSGRFISYFHQFIHHKNHYIWWDTGLLLNGSTIGYRYMSEDQNLLVGSYLAYDRYGDYMLDGQSYSVYQMNVGLELSSAYLGQLTANFYGVPVSAEALDSLCGRELNWAQDAWIKRRALKIVDDHGVSIKWITRPFAPSLQASIVLARSWIKQESVYHWDKGRIDRVGIGLQYLLGDSVHIDIQYMLRDAYQQGWRIGMKIGNMRAYREQNNLLGQLNRPPERHIPTYKTYQDVESASTHDAPLKADLFSKSGFGFGPIDSNIKRGVFDYFKAASADERSSRQFPRDGADSVEGLSYVRRSQSAGHASHTKYAYVSVPDLEESDGSISSKQVRYKRSAKGKHRDTNLQPKQSTGSQRTHEKVRNVSEPNPPKQNFHPGSSKAPTVDWQSASHFSEGNNQEERKFHRTRSTDREFTATHRVETDYLYVRYKNRLDELDDGRLIASVEKVYYYPDGTIHKSELVERYVASEPMPATQRPTDTHSYPYSNNYKSGPSYSGNNRAPKKEGGNKHAHATYTNSKPNISGYSTNGYHSLPRYKKPTAEQHQEERSGNVFEQELGEKEAKLRKMESALKFTPKEIKFFRNCSTDELTKWHRKTILRVHPDKQGGKSEAEIKAASDQFIQVQSYYELLSEHKKR